MYEYYDQVVLPALSMSMNFRAVPNEHIYSVCTPIKSMSPDEHMCKHPN